MKLSNRYILPVGTLGVALTIGVAMQQGFGGDPAPSEAAQVQQQGFTVSRADTPPAPGTLEQAKGAQASTPELTGITPTSAPTPPREAGTPGVLGQPPLRQVTASEPEIAELPNEAPVPGFSCEIDMTAELRDAAMVRLSLQAPCLTEERVTLHHNGLMITETVGPDGALSVDIPALSRNAVFIAAFANGEGAVAQTEVPSLAGFERVALQWRNAEGLELHALEFGAAYGEPGHVWHGAARDPQAASSDEGGFLVRLGDPKAPESMMAEIYSFPISAAGRDGEVRLSVEAQVTAGNCGQEITAQTLEQDSGGQVSAHDLSFFMPDCDGLGDFLVLKNLPEDLKIAAN